MGENGETVKIKILQPEVINAVLYLVFSLNLLMLPCAILISDVGPQILVNELRKILSSGSVGNEKLLISLI